MGLQEILGALVTLYAESKAPVFLLNTPQEEQSVLFEDLALEGVASMPNVVDTDVPVGERGEL